MNNRINHLYPLQVWFLTILTAPMIIGVSLVEWEGIDMEEITTTISFVGASIVFGAALSLPTLAACYISFFVLARTKITGKTIKTLLAILAIAGFIISFYVIGLDILEFSTRDMVLPLSFFICIIGFGRLFQIRKAVAKGRHENAEESARAD